jgi:hypothetical protein
MSFNGYPEKPITWLRNEEVLSSFVDEEAILMSIQNNNYYSLDPIASRIWQLLEQPHSLAQLCEILTTEYEVDARSCEQETSEFLQALQEKNLVRQVPSE